MPAASLFSAPVLGSMLGFPLRRAAWGRPLVNLAVVYLALFFVFPPLAMLIEAGYALQIARRLLAGCPAELAEPAAWEPLLLDGLRYWCVVIVFSLPALVVAAVGFIASLWFSGAFGENGAAAYLQFLVDHFWAMYAFCALVLLLAIVAMILSNIATLHMLRRGSLAAAFDVRAWWPVLRANSGGFFQAELFLVAFILVLLLAQLLLGIVTLITCIGPIVVLGLAELYQRLVLTAVYARAYQIGADRMRV